MVVKRGSPSSLAKLLDGNILLLDKHMNQWRNGVVRGPEDNTFHGAPCNTKFHEGVPHPSIGHNVKDVRLLKSCKKPYYSTLFYKVLLGPL